jgi:carbamate kinase
VSNGANVPIVLVAMGGHAFMQKGEKGTIEDHERNAEVIAALLMTLVERGYHLVITHGNGPQVGSLLLQHEMAREEAPQLPLDVLVRRSGACSSSTRWRARRRRSCHSTCWSR